MEHPSPESGSAFRFGEGEIIADSLWDPADSTFIESLFAPAPEPVHRVDGVGNPSADLAVSPPTCRSQAARAVPRVRPGIDLISSPFPDAEPRWSGLAPVAAQQPAPVPPSTLSNIARQFYAANVSSRSRRTSLSMQLPSAADGFYPAGHVAAALNPPFPVNANAAYPPLDGPVNLGSLPTLGLPHPQPSFDPVSLLSTGFFAQWTPSAGSGVNQTPGGHLSFPLSPLDVGTTFDSFNGSSGPRLNDSNASSWTRNYYPLSPTSHISDDPVDHDYRRRASTAARNATVPKAITVPNPPPTKARRSTCPPKSPPTDLAFVQYKPPNTTEAKSSKKRPALEEIAPQGMASRTLRQVLVHDDDGKVKGTMMTFGNRVKRRAVFSEEKRLQTAEARKKGCDLAQKQSLYVSCTLCTEHKIYKNAPRHPCFKTTLADILFFRSGPAANEPFFTKRTMVYDLADLSKPDVPARMLKLTQHIGHHQLTVYASEFMPSPADVVSYKWHDRSGQSHELKMPHFCLTNMEKIHRHFRQYIDSAKWSYLTSLETEDELDSLVADSLDLWAISRMIEIPWQMCGPDTLGVDLVTDPTSPQRGRVPIPPMMDTQLDQIVIQFILTPLRERVVEKFEQLITPAKRDAWWEVYLSAFILLNHIERLARHSVSHARTHTMPGKYSNIPFLEAVFHTAKSILARFHFVCNGSVPLKLDWTSPRVAAMATLEPGQVAFMQRTQAMIATRGILTHSIPPCPGP
ncbi:hypothetical protein C8A01DRAFT_19292 [Parachaetomium inaequale]|uniref:Uncharacterized protein n=1 Tax=Parachaetomium inaequale TaxID=2588326 RepID=A0AAN6PAI8_9PEZI|nr:hypothetical protein C8A01DRAFT_19292 [Parachaetomium inaequale]